MIYKEKFEEILQHYGVKGMVWDAKKKKSVEMDADEINKLINEKLRKQAADKKKAEKDAWKKLGKDIKSGAKKKATSAYKNTKEFIKNPSLPKKKVKKKSPVKKTPVMQVGEKQGPPVAKGSISNYNRKPTTGRKTSLTSPKTRAPKSKMKITTHFDKYTGPTQKEFDETIKRARKSMYDKMSPYEKMKYNIRNRGKK